MSRARNSNSARVSVQVQRQHSAVQLPCARDQAKVIETGENIHVVVPPLNSHREEEAAYDMVVLEAKTSYLYTIPSFYVICLKLRYIYARAEDESGVNFYDVFFHEFPGCSSLQMSHPAVVRVTNGCK